MLKNLFSCIPVMFALYCKQKVTSTNTNQFTTDRINNFSDAVFAIALTLLILDVKLPATELIERQGPIHALWQSQSAQIIGLIVSFFVSALFWKFHLTLAKTISSYDNNLIWLNTLLLFFVVIMPFSTGFYSKNFGYNTAFFFYCLNLTCIGVMNHLMTRYAIRKERLQNHFSAIEIRWMKQRTLIVPIVFLLCIPLSYISPIIGRLGFLLIFVFQTIGERIVKKRMVKRNT